MSLTPSQYNPRLELQISSDQQNDSESNDEDDVRSCEQDSGRG